MAHFPEQINLNVCGREKGMSEDIDLLPGNGQFKVEAIPKEQEGAGEEDDRKRAEHGNRRAFESSFCP